MWVRYHSTVRGLRYNWAPISEFGQSVDGESSICDSCAVKLDRDCVDAFARGLAGRDELTPRSLSEPRHVPWQSPSEGGVGVGNPGVGQGAPQASADPGAQRVGLRMAFRNTSCVRSSASAGFLVNRNACR
jgi:hypothetical protein